MTEILVYDTWNGLTFGYDGEEIVFSLVASPGLHGKVNDGTNLKGAFHGQVSTPLWAAPVTWTTETEVRGSTDAEWRQRRDEFLAATSSPDEGEYVVHDAGEERTYFARVLQRDMNRDSDGEVDWDALGSVTFVADDPHRYGPAETIEFSEGTDTSVIDTTGWVPSERWVWTVPGPVTNPQLSSSVGSTACIRYGGTVPDGSVLIVELLPKCTPPGYYAKVLPEEDAADYRTFGTGSNAYPQLDPGAAYSDDPPGWFAISDGDTITAVSGVNGSTLVWRPGFD